jgi:hypothetical protein
MGYFMITIPDMVFTYAGTDRAAPSLPPPFVVDEQFGRCDAASHPGPREDLFTAPEDPADRPDTLNMAQILAWADAHHTHTGEWPAPTSGPVTDAPGETWGTIQYALYRGRRGLPGGDTLARLLRRAGRIGERRGRPARPERRRWAARLRAQGLSLSEIGQQLGVSRQAAWQLLRRNGEPATCPGA